MFMQRDGKSESENVRKSGRVRDKFSRKQTKCQADILDEILQKMSRNGYSLLKIAKERDTFKHYE